MIQFGIAPHAAVATNMMALVFMSIGGSLPFARKGILYRRHLPTSIAITIIGSALGALLLLEVPMRALQLIIALAMIVVAVFSIVKQDGAEREIPVSHKRELAGYGMTFLLAVYGGFFSGGCVTLLTAAFVFLFGMTLLQSVATTKVINAFSSAVATAVFMSRGVVDYKLGSILGITMFVGAMVGGHSLPRECVVPVTSSSLRRIVTFAELRTVQVSPTWLRPLGP